MNKPVHFGIMSILAISKTLMYEFRYDYIQPKNQNKAKLCCMNTESLFMLKPKIQILTKILQMMLENGLTHKTILNITKDRFQ